MNHDNDVLAAAMMNDGVTAFRTSVRGAPRGPLCGMGVCFECRTTVDDSPHQRSCLFVRHERVAERDHGDLLEAQVAVVGAGPAGIAAAYRAAQEGKLVALLDSAAEPGGQIWRHRTGAPSTSFPDVHGWVARAAHPNVKIIRGAEVVDAPAPGELTVAAVGATLRVRANAIVLATGARELFLPFPGWTLPNVLGAGGLQALAKNGFDVRGQRVVLAGSGPLLFPVAAYLAGHGARLRTVAEQAPPEVVRAFARSLWRDPSRLRQAMNFRAMFWRARYRTGCWVARADGDDRVREVTLTDGVRSWREPCDLLACGFGLVPNVEVAQLLGAPLSPAGIEVNGRQETRIAGVFAAGECTGIGGAPLAIAEGEIAGLAAAGARVIPPALADRREWERATAARVERAFALRSELRALAAPDTIVCRCEDVPHAAIAACGSAREAKLRTRAGMGACQGRVCGAAMRFLHGWDPPEPRVPAFPVPVDALAK